MDKNQFSRFATNLSRLGASGLGRPEFLLGRSGKYALQYIPFEHINTDAKLVIVGITPGPNQLDLAYAAAQLLLKRGLLESEVLWEVKKVGAFGGPKMKPNLLKMLRHFQFDKVLGIQDVETLWGKDAGLLHSTSVVPHAAFKDGEMFNGSFDEVMKSPLLKECFLDCFVPSTQAINQEALYVGLGSCPQAALEWCVNNGHLRQSQILGSFCHPSSNAGSETKYYLREVSKDELKGKDPVRYRCERLDAAYAQMKAGTSALIGSNLSKGVRL